MDRASQRVKKPTHAGHGSVPSPAQKHSPVAVDVGARIAVTGVSGMQVSRAWHRPAVLIISVSLMQTGAGNGGCRGWRGCHMERSVLQLL